MRESIINIVETLPATIASGASLSGGINLGGLRLFALSMPSAWTTASLTFLVSADNGSTWSSLYDASGNEVTVAAAASRCITLDPALFAAVQYLQIRSGTSATPVAQGQNSSLQLILRAV